MLREFGPSVTGVLHCFGGPTDMLELALDLGWLVSFTGSATFKRFDQRDPPSGPLGPVYAGERRSLPRTRTPPR